MRPIVQAWQRHLNVRVPRPTSAVHIEEIRRAFYAGVTALFGMLAGGLERGAEEPTPEDLELLEGIAAELTDHLRQLNANARLERSGGDGERNVGETKK